MEDLFEDELLALWKWFDFKTPADQRSAFVAFANAANQET